MKLKTLKDMGYTGDPKNCRCGVCSEGLIGCDIQAIKKEAVKWVKHEEKGWTQNIEGKEYNCSPTIKAWIKMFFNLTSGDVEGDLR